MEGTIFQKSAMKGMMKGKILKKLKTIKQVGYLTPDRILQVRAAEGFVDSFQKISNYVAKKTEDGVLGFSLMLEKPRKCDENDENVNVKDADAHDNIGDGIEIEDKENVRPLDGNLDKHSILAVAKNPLCDSDVSRYRRPDVNVKKVGVIIGMEVEDKQNVGSSERIDDKDSILAMKTPLCDIDVSSFRRPDLNAGSLFDPKLLAAFEEVKRIHRLISIKAEERLLTELVQIKEEDEEQEQKEEPPLKVQKIENDPLAQFELKCPPGGSDAVILYTTTLRGIRKTFEDCQSIKFLLQTFRVQFFERDVSMHAEYRTEMCLVLENDMALPPQLFIKGRFIGGAEEVLRLHEQGKFRVLLEGIGVDEGNCMCDGCGGMRFVLCFKCSGSRRVDLDGVWEKCGVCNENGLIVCPYCC